MPYVYIMASHSKTLYVGVTRHLLQRVAQHRQGLPGSFTTKYRVTRLAYFETWPSMVGAIGREKKLKRYRRLQKIKLVERHNPDWLDLAEAWFRP